MYAALLAERVHDFDDAAIALVHLAHDEPSWLPSRPLAERIAYLDSPLACFRRCAARSADLPPEVVRRLHEHDDIQVRRIAAARADTPADVLERLLNEHGEHPKYRPRLVEHPNFPQEAFVKLATAEDHRRGALAAEGQDLPVEPMRELLARAGLRGPPVTPGEPLL